MFTLVINNGVENAPAPQEVNEVELEKEPEVKCSFSNLKIESNVLYVLNVQEKFCTLLEF